MTTEREMLRIQVLNQPGVTALIGARLFPQTLPQGAAMPAVTLTRISRVGDQGQTGPGLPVTRWQFDCWGATQAEADAVAEALIGALDARRDVVPGVSFVENDVDGYEPTTTRWRRIVDVMIWR